jgi:hypothetical protein
LKLSSNHYGRIRMRKVVKTANLGYLCICLFVFLYACESGDLSIADEVYGQATVYMEDIDSLRCVEGEDTTLVKIKNQLFFCPFDSVINQVYIGNYSYPEYFFNEGVSYLVKNNELFMIEDTLVFKGRASTWSLTEGSVNPIDSVLISFSSDFTLGDKVVFSTIKEIQAADFDLEFLVNSDIEVVNVEFTKRNVTYIGRLEYQNHGYANSYTKNVLRDHFAFYVDGSSEK